jgi:hypothetical protein
VKQVATVETGVVSNGCPAGDPVIQIRSGRPLAGQEWSQPVRTTSELVGELSVVMLRLAVEWFRCVSRDGAKAWAEDGVSASAWRPRTRV